MDPGFVDRLEELGFFQYIAGDQLQTAKEGFVGVGWSGVYGESGRLFPADAEDLAEGGVGDFLREIEPFLRQQGVTLSQVEDRFGEDSYGVVVNGKTYLIYDAQELQRTQQELGLSWGLSTMRSFALVNGLLADAGSGERLYAVNGGNDLFGFFLTPELHDVIRSHPDATPRDRPYVPRDEPPWYGQEHD